MTKKYSFFWEKAQLSGHDFFLHDHRLDQEKQYYCARLLKDKKLKIILFVAIQDKTAVSIPSAPFGGFWIEKKISSEYFEFFVGLVMKELRLMEMSFFKLIQPPSPYQDCTEVINYVLFRLGFRLEEVLMHQFISDRRFIKSSLAAKQGKSQRKLKKLGWEIQIGQIKNLNFLQDIYQWRELRNHTYNVREDSLIQQISAYPDRHFIISVLSEKETLAHVLCVKLTSNSLYYYLPAINPVGQHAFAGEALMFGVIRLAENLGVDFIDLGSSDLTSGINHNLLRFKGKFTNLEANKLAWKYYFDA